LYAGPRTNHEPVTHDVKKMLMVHGVERCTQIQKDLSANVTVIDGLQYLVNNAD